MRPNNRTKILDAAVRVVERDGLRRLTLEATADEADLTRGGMMYHFSDRDSLLDAVHHHAAAQWENLLLAALEVPYETSTAIDRAIAYVRAAMTPATPGQVVLALEAQHSPATATLWSNLQRRWIGGADDLEPRSTSIDVALLAADGLWLHEAIGATPLSDEQRHAVADSIIHTLKAATSQHA